MLFRSSRGIRASTRPGAIQAAEDAFWNTGVEVGQQQPAQHEAVEVNEHDFWTTGVKVPGKRTKTRDLFAERDKSDDYGMEL